jgi:hypothetical protein
MQEEEGKTPEEDKGTEESEKVKDVFCLSLYISHRFRTNIESNEGGKRCFLSVSVYMYIS